MHAINLRDNLINSFYLVITSIFSMLLWAFNAGKSIFKKIYTGQTKALIDKQADVAPIPDTTSHNTFKLSVSNNFDTQIDTPPALLFVANTSSAEQAQAQELQIDLISPEFSAQLNAIFEIRSLIEARIRYIKNLIADLRTFNTQQCKHFMNSIALHLKIMIDEKLPNSSKFEEIALYDYLREKFIEGVTLDLNRLEGYLLYMNNIFEINQCEPTIFLSLLNSLQNEIRTEERTNQISKGIVGRWVQKELKKHEKKINKKLSRQEREAFIAEKQKFNEFDCGELATYMKLFAVLNDTFATKFENDYFALYTDTIEVIDYTMVKSCQKLNGRFLDLLRESQKNTVALKKDVSALFAASAKDSDNDSDNDIFMQMLGIAERQIDAAFAWMNDGNKKFDVVVSQQGAEELFRTYDNIYRHAETLSAMQAIVKGCLEQVQIAEKMREQLPNQLPLAQDEPEFRSVPDMSNQPQPQAQSQAQAQAQTELSVAAQAPKIQTMSIEPAANKVKDNLNLAKKLCDQAKERLKAWRDAVDKQREENKRSRHKVHVQAAAANNPINNSDKAQMVFKISDTLAREHLDEIIEFLNAKSYKYARVRVFIKNCLGGEVEKDTKSSHERIIFNGRTYQILHDYMMPTESTELKETLVRPHAGETDLSKGQLEDLKNVVLNILSDAMLRLFREDGRLEQKMTRRISALRA